MEGSDQYAHLADTEWMNMWADESVLMCTESYQCDNCPMISTNTSTERVPENSHIDLINTPTCNSELLSDGQCILETNVSTKTELNLIIDSGDTATVCGIAWIRAWCNSSTIETKLQTSNRMFKFGDSRRFKSLGCIELHGIVQVSDRDGSITRKPLGITTDVVDSMIPLLLSRRSLSLLSVSLDFAKNRLVFPDHQFIVLTVLAGGHLAFEFLCAELPRSNPLELVCALDSSIDSSAEDQPSSAMRLLDRKLFMRLHYQLGHCDAGSIKRLCDLNHVKFDLELARKWISECGCDRDDRIPQCPIVSRHISSEPGEVLMCDISFHVSTTFKSILLSLWCARLLVLSCVDS